MSDGLSFAEHVRARPGMYIGNSQYQGISELMTNVIIDCVTKSKSTQLLVSINVDALLSFNIHFQANDIDPSLADFLNNPKWNHDTMSISILHALSSELNVKLSENDVKLSSNLDASIFKQASISYDHLIEHLSQIALLNPGTEVVVNDTRARFPRQEYYHYPYGLRHIFDRLCTEQASRLKFYVRKEMDKFTYSIGVAFSTRWTNHSTLISYAAHKKTIGHGSLIDGILKGIVLAAKDFIGPETAHEYDFSRRRLLAYKHLIVIAHAKGDESLINWEGSTRQKINVPVIKKDATTITLAEYLATMRANPEKATEQINWLFRKPWYQ